MAEFGQLTLAAWPVVHEQHIIPPAVRKDITAAEGVQVVIERLSPIGELRVSSNIALGVGIDEPEPGYEYLYHFGRALSETAGSDADVTADLARATPVQAVRLGVSTLASAIDSMVRRHTVYAPGAVDKAALDFAVQLRADGAQMYRPEDRRAALDAALVLEYNSAMRQRAAETAVTSARSRIHRSLTSREAAAAAVGFWAAKSNVPDVVLIARADADLHNPYLVNPEVRVQNLDQRAAAGNQFVKHVVKGASVTPEHLATSTPLDHYWRGVKRAASYIALATQEFAVQAR